ncbi:MAG: hypothetical protein ACFFD6_07805, partial [Candidatus Thorarchaeota archaeon]
WINRCRLLTRTLHNEEKELMTDMKRHAFILVLIALFLVTPASGTPSDYSPDLMPRDSVSTIVTWTVVEAPKAPFELWFSGTGHWVATNGSQMILEISEIDADVEGHLTLGNTTLFANDTDIARDLTIGVWGSTPWLPGLVVKIGGSNIDDLNQTAFAAAERTSGNYLNGTMTSSYDTISSNGILYDCIVFEFEQDPTGFGEPQLTTLAYDTDTGVLVKADTSYSFGTPYSLILELQGIEIPTVDPSFLWVGVAVSGVVIIAVAIIWTKR